MIWSFRIYCIIAKLQSGSTSGPPLTHNAFGELDELRGSITRLANEDKQSHTYTQSSEGRTDRRRHCQVVLLTHMHTHLHTHMLTCETFRGRGHPSLDFWQALFCRSLIICLYLLFGLLQKSEICASKKKKGFFCSFIPTCSSSVPAVKSLP